MKAPKILPWIARKAGISDELALKLWRRAAGEAEELTGCCTSSDYYRLAMERFIDLADAESEACEAPQTLCNPHVSWLWRHQTRMSQLSLLAAQNTYRFWQSNWDNFLATQKRAA
ncbi:MAG: hypothetical protein BGO63_10710 [Candidatus Accumulibacter sp. 66-26]|nr:hypothetical protein [Accumulibacter sp.]OJW48739.1 MAG: hypothetical protein BGO63_10710 [Candidatus Accumulibacter sp. 66-26]